tara:strand:+ start:6222 stop:6851 length:630 start_codon:yes stop_codon:yes gene_type:complete
MNFLVSNINDFIENVIYNYNEDVDIDTSLKDSISNAFEVMFGDSDNSTALVNSIATLVRNDLDVGDAYYTKTDGEPTLKKFMVNEARLRQANESRGRMKNKIDEVLGNLVGTAESCSNVRVTNIDSFSALMDRLTTERIKRYNFLYKQNKKAEAAHQEIVIESVLVKIKELLYQILKEDGYVFVGEKRTFDESKLIEDVSQILKNIDDL